MSNRFYQGLSPYPVRRYFNGGPDCDPQVQAGSTTPENAEPNNTMQASRKLRNHRAENPGSIVERLEGDAEPKDYLFQFPGVTGVLKPWYDLKAGLDEKYGFTFGISYTSYYQKANDTFGPEDDAASFDLDISGTWDFSRPWNGFADDAWIRFPLA